MLLCIAEYSGTAPAGNSHSQHERRAAPMHAVMSVSMWVGAVQFWHKQMCQLGICVCVAAHCQQRMSFEGPFWP